MPRGFVHFVGVAAVAAAFGLSVYVVADPLRRSVPRLAAERLERGRVQAGRYTWIEIGGFKAELAFRLDTLSAVMILIVTFVGTLIHLYSTGYMEHDDRPPRTSAT